jgi:hypothetical protein
MAPRRRTTGLSLEEAVAHSLAPISREDRAKQDAANFSGFIETYYNQMESFPSLERLKNEFPERTEKSIREDVLLAAAKLEAKGHAITKRDYLTPEQLAVANSIMNLADKRSITKKLQDFGVSPAKYANWKKNPVFNGYLRDRTESQLGESVPDVHLALIDAATSGDLQAIKLFYEITGRHTQNSQQNVNVQVMLTGVIEAVAEFVHDPVILQQIAARIQENTSLSGNVIKGELTQ